MVFFHPAPEQLPREIAVFPLTGALLLPRGKLPLNIFEPRYLAMVEDSLANGRMFGMIQPDHGQPEGPLGPGLFHIGCLGRLSSFSETEDGRLLITLTGVARFHLVSELPEIRGYRRAKVDYTGFLSDLELVPLRLGTERTRLTDALRAYFLARGLDANWDAINQMPDHVLLVTLAMACPFEPAEKQALLQAPSDTERAEILLALLQMAAHDPGDDEGPRNAS